MSAAPKSGYARTQTADGGVQFSYQSARFGPGMPALLAVAPGLILFAMISFKNFDAMGPAFIALLIYTAILLFVVNKTSRSFTVYPDRIVTHDGATVAFSDITHLGWQSSHHRTRFIPFSYTFAQAMGRKINITGWVKEDIATGLQNEIKRVSEVSFSS